MKIELSKSFIRELTGRVEKYEFEIGVLEDKPHKEPIETAIFEPPQLTKYAGGDVRKKSRNLSEMTTAEIFVANQERLNTNLILEPLEQQNSDINKFTRAFLEYVAGGKASVKRLENLLQAIVRNPILRQEYGKNKPATADAKGFDRHLFDTGQMFQAIKAKVIRRGK